MSVAKKIHGPSLSLKVPFSDEERKAFDHEADIRHVKKGQLVRSLLLAWVNPSTVKIMEDAMRKSEASA